MVLLSTTQETTVVAVQLDSSQVEQFGQMFSFSAGLLAFVCLMVGGLLIIEIHRG